MKWRFVDRIESCEPWTSIRGRKAVSFEEYSLLKNFNRKGTLPEALALESLVQLARWLIAKSSDFTQIGTLSKVEALKFEQEAVMGDSLSLEIRILERKGMSIRMGCDASTSSGTVCQGTIVLDAQPLAGFADPHSLRSMWGEISVPA
ncbi:MAG: hypothetical protein WCU88_10505 [Elusimicrobiota bacterium]|jgi:3-hydroxymyristoyl/3-hydroxydecanoyl-(acyl carrier protein) dehydratase